ncbi:MAG: hypothetical protein ACLFPE_08985 [Bacteroidales bacterium]
MPGIADFCIQAEFIEPDQQMHISALNQSGGGKQFHNLVNGYLYFLNHIDGADHTAGNLTTPVKNL